MPDTPLSALGINHRSKWFADIVDPLEANIRQLTSMSSEYECAFLQGGGSLQFSMIPMNFLRGQPLLAALAAAGYCYAYATTADHLRQVYKWRGVEFTAEQVIGGYRRTLLRWDLLAIE